MSPRFARSHLAAAAGAALTVSAANVVVLGFDWQALDDFTYVLHQPSVTTPFAAGWETLFTPRMGHAMPLTNATLAFDFARCGGNAGCFRQTSLLLVALTSASLTYALARFGALAPRRGRASIAPWAAALAVIVAFFHPTTAEPIAWITSRKDLLSGAFAASGLALTAHHAEGLREGNARALALCAAAFAGAMLSKTSTLFFPLVFGGILVAWRTPAERIVAALAPLFGLGAAVAYAATRYQEEIGNRVEYATLAERVDSAGASVLGHIGRLAHQSPETPFVFPDMWPAPSIGWTLPGVASGLFFVGGGLAALTVLVRAWRRGTQRCPPLAIALALALVTLLPISAWLGRIRMLVADRYLYLPLTFAGSALLAIGVSALHRALTRALDTRSKQPERAAAIALAFALGAAALAQLPLRAQSLDHYRDAHSLSSRMLATYPPSDAVALNGGLYYYSCIIHGLGYGVFAHNHVPPGTFEMTEAERVARIQQARDVWRECESHVPPEPNQVGRDYHRDLGRLASQAESVLSGYSAAPASGSLRSEPAPGPAPDAGPPSEGGPVSDVGASGGE